MRIPTRILTIAALTLGLLATGVALPSSAEAARSPLNPETGSFVPPPGYSYDTDTFSKASRNWGRVDQVLPTVVGNGYGTNNRDAAQAIRCIPGPGESPEEPLISYSAAFVNSYCILHPGQITLRVGTTAAPSDNATYEFEGSTRLLFIRKSTTPDCLTAPTTVMQPIEPYRKTEVVYNVGPTDVNKYLCFAQGFSVEVTEPSIGGIDEVFGYHMRGSWTIYKVADMAADARPINVRATPGNGRVTLNWEIANPNALTNLKFIAASTPSDRTCQATAATACTITGLTNGTPYTFIVYASVGLVGLRSDRSAAVVPAAGGAAASPAASQPAPLIVNASSLRAAVPSVEPVRGNTVEPLTTVRVTTVTTGTPANGETVRTRTLVVCLTGERGDPCRGASRTIQLEPNIAAQSTIVWIPRNAGGKFLRIWQNISTSLGPLVARPAYTYVRNTALQNANVDAAAADAGLPAGADAGVIQEAPAAAAPAGAAAGNAEQAQAGAGAAAAPAAEPAAASGDAAATGSEAEAAARAAGVDLANSPVADAAGQGTGAAAALTMQLAASSKVNRGRAISMKAVITPKASAGRVRIALVRVTPRGKYVSTKALYAPMKAGTASKRWRIPRSFTPAQFTLVATFEPANGGPGITRTAPVTIG